MSKLLLPLCLLLLLSAGLRAQKVSVAGHIENPFNKLQFNGGPTDTITIVGTYDGIYGPISEKNISALEVIQKLNGISVKKFKYSIGFMLDGYPQKFYAPTLDNGMYAMLASKQNSVKRLRLKCIVYRFYTIDGITNFFYIDKAGIAESSI